MSDHKKRRLIIISDTPMWKGEDGQVHVYEPTLREIEQLDRLFSEIIWIGFHRRNYLLGAGRPTDKTSLSFHLLLPSGGHTMQAKLRSIVLLPYYIFTVLRFMMFNTYIHTRGPSVPALIAILFSFLFPRKKYWHKYAGNWDARRAPFFYRLQKRILLRAPFSKVTLNGIWNDQRPHTLSFENPCFTMTELKEANDTLLEKDFNPPYTICFVGRLEEAKGVDNLLRALPMLTQGGKIKKLILAGGGQRRSFYEEIAKNSDINVEFAGSLNRDELNGVYAQSHILILPSRSEGFPKVLAEGAAFGCIPVMTAVSSLHQYFNDGINGYLLADNGSETISSRLDLILTSSELAKVSRAVIKLAAQFSYEEFVNRIANEVFESD